MTSISDAAAWPVFIGTARGSTHESRHAPNQDSAGSQPVIPGAGVVVAVADGHGAARHFRSATGSALAVKAALAVVEELAGPVGGPWQAETADAVRGQLPRAIVARWRELVAGHLASDPFSADEAAALELTRDDPEIPYGSTLLVGLIVDSWLICAQIGDGDMLAVRPDGGAWIPVGGDARLDGFRTTSLCQAEAVGSFRTAVHDLRTESLLALQLSTDGYGNAQVTDPWQPAVAADLAGLAAGHDHDWFQQQIPLWAQRCASAQGSGDDTTIALLLAPDSARLAATAAPAAAATATVPAAATVLLPAGAAAGTVPPAPPGRLAAEPPRTGRAGPGGPRPSRRRAGLTGLAVVVVAAGIAIGVVVSQSSPGSAPATRSTGQPAQKATPPATKPAPRATSSAAVPAGPAPATGGNTSASSGSSGEHHVTGGQPTGNRVG